MSLFHCYDVNIEAKNVVHYKQGRWSNALCSWKNALNRDKVYEKIMIFIVIDNGNSPPARIEISENKDG